MRSLRALLLRSMGILGKRRPDSELSEELESHLAMQIEDNMRSGMNADEARRQALIRSGGMAQSKERYREQTRLPFLETLFQDLRYGARMLRKNPGFTTVAILTLALGIGANTAIFSVVNGVLLRPLPYEDPARLMAVYSSFDGLPHDSATSPPDFRTLREQNHTFAGLSAWFTESSNLTDAGQPERLVVSVVSANYFSTFGVQPFLGRNFLPSEDKWGAHGVAIASYEFWRSHLNSNPNIAGKTFNLDGEPYSLIGVMPADFVLQEKIQLWVPMAWKPGDSMDSHNNYFISMLGRLKPGVKQQQAYADLNAIMLNIAQKFPENKGIGADLKPLHEAWVGGTRPALMILLGAVGLVLLIACVNLANLLLARSSGRQKEVAIRAALGASSSRLLRQFITESVLLSLLGGSLGLVLAYLSQRLLPLAKDMLPMMSQIHLDSWVLLFTLGISLLTGVLFGLMPALRSSRAQKLNASLKEGGRTSENGAGDNRMRTGLVISEVALALLLLIGSGLAIRSFQRLLRVDPGFSAEHVLSFQVSFPDSYYPEGDPFRIGRIGGPPRVVAFYEQLLERIEQLPGVMAAGATSSLPLQSRAWGKMFTPLDRPLPTSMDKVEHIQYRPVAGHFFRSLGIRLLKGRLLDEHDQADSPYSVVVNEALARKYWPDQNPIGKQILLAPPENLLPPNLLPAGVHEQKFTIVGVVADAHYVGLDAAPQPMVYASIRQHDTSGNPSFTVRTTGDPKALVSSIRSEIAQIDKGLPMANVTTMEEIMSSSVAQPRLEAVLLGLFGGLAMALAAVGIYGVMSYSVSERTSEIGIRMALGASPASILRMVCKQGLVLTAIGLAAGLGLALGLTRLMSKLLFGVSPTDPMTFVVIVVLLAVVALLACYVPARRATKVDPLVALRYE